MIKDDIYKMLKYKTPPDTDDEAIERVSEAASSSFLGLIGCVFLDLAQFQRAMSHHQWNLRARPLMKSGRVRTYKATSIGPDGTAYDFIINELGNWHCEIINCKLAAPGANIEPEDLAAFEETIGS